MVESEREVGIRTKHVSVTNVESMILAVKVLNGPYPYFRLDLFFNDPYYDINNKDLRKQNEN